MAVSRSKYFLLALVLALQVLSATGFARDAYVCVRPDGTSRLESSAQVEQCKYERLAPADEAVVSEASCTDYRLTPEVSARPSHSGNSLDFSLPPVALPEFLVTLSQPISIPHVTRINARARGVPDLVRVSLCSIVLVI
jgi:hypothetical protein